MFYGKCFGTGARGLLRDEVTLFRGIGCEVVKFVTVVLVEMQQLLVAAKEECQGRLHRPSGER
jgi:hypothetical protein